VLFHGQEWLVSLLDIRDLLALRLVSRKTRDWLDAVMPKHPTKAFTLNVDENTALDGLVNEEIAHGIPFFRILNIRHSSFCSNPLIPSFLRIYGPQIRIVDGSYEVGDVVPHEVAFYEALPNLTQLSTNWLGNNVADVKMPALNRLQLYRIPYQGSERAEKLNFHFLLNFPKLIHLWLPCWCEDDYLGAMSALGQYFAIRNEWVGSSGKTLTISFNDIRPGDFDEELIPTEGVARLLQELAVADGRILIEKMAVQLLDEAVRLFHHPRGGQLLRSFGKCILSLRGFTSSLYEVELPNLRKLDVSRVSVETKAMDGHYARTVSWPKLEEVELDIGNSAIDVSFLAKLVFGSGVLRLSVKRVHFSLQILLSLDSKEAHLLLGSFPNLTRLTLDFKAEEVGLLRLLMRSLPTSCSKIQLLELTAFFPFGEEDFFGVNGEEGLVPSPLLQLPGKEMVSNEDEVLVINFHSKPSSNGWHFMCIHISGE
jgi:hypothetical protein